MVDTDLVFILVTITALTLCTHAQENERLKTEKQIVDHLDNVRRQLNYLVEDVESLKSIIEPCTLIGNIENCRLASADFAKDAQLLQSNSDSTPAGKRSNLSAIKRAERFQEDLIKKRQTLDGLRELLSNMAARVHEERKKSCTLNLAYHCKASEYAAISDIYNYLNSNQSPGRRKRASRQ